MTRFAARFGSVLFATLLALPARAAPPAPKAAAPADAPAALTVAPKLLHFVAAPSPASLAERGEVSVVLSIDIDEQGAVSHVEVAESGGDDYDEAALAAAKQFQFSPGYAGTTPVPVRITYRYRFRMQAPPVPTPAAPPEKSVEEKPAEPQPVTVPFDGRVLRKGDRVPLIGATVEVVLDVPEVDPKADKAAKAAAQAQLAAAAPAFTAETDAEGRFSFAAVPVGRHLVRVGGTGLVTAQAREALRAGKALTATYYVEERTKYSTTVRAARLRREIVERSLDIDEIKRIPGTQGDTLKAVQNLPGVARAPFGLGQLIVWGSNPADTRVYVDGVYIPTLYHFGGLRSTINSEVVQSLDFTPGGYSAEHGWGVGGLVEVETRKPRTPGYHGYVQLDAIDGSLLIEGPITKNLSFGLSARRSWIDLFLPLITPNNFQLSPVYYDYQARLRWRASSRDDVEVMIFGSDDAIGVKTKSPNPQLTAQFDSHIFYHRLLARWEHRFEGGASLSITPSVGFDVPFDFGAQLGNVELSAHASLVPYSLRSVLHLPLAPFLRLDAGLDFEGSRYGLSAKSPAGGPPVEGEEAPRTFGSGQLDGTGTVYVHQIAPWVSLPLTLFDNKLTVTGGLRLAIFSLSGNYDFPGLSGVGVPASDHFNHPYFGLEPRLSVRYDVVPQFTLKAALGVYHQAPDAGALFGPFGNPAALPQRSVHYVAGFEVNPTRTLNVSVEGFYKELRNLLVRGEVSGQPALVNDGIGRVYGMEVMVRQQLWKGLWAWVSYTLSRSERKDHPDTPDWRVFQYDQTHILTAIASYQFPRGYQVGLRFRYVTGNPYTAVDGSYIDLNTGRYQPIYGPIYGSRLASFNQLDLRFDKIWTFRQWKLAVYVDIQNLYNAKNPEAYQANYDYSQTQPIAGIPFFPTLGIRGDF